MKNFTFAGVVYMIKSSSWLFVFFYGFFSLLIALATCSKSFAFLPEDDPWQPTRILCSNIKSFFGDLRGTFRLYNQKLSFQIDDGLENDRLSGRQVIQLPKVGKGLYLESGSTETDFPLFSSVLITPTEKVASAAMLGSAGLSVFLRPSGQNSFYITVFKKWAQDLWCSENPVYGGLGFGFKLNQKFDDCRPLQVKIFYLSGYGNRSVN